FIHEFGDLSSFFFFSSRRRHTRWPRDWSSDVCSSDLHQLATVLFQSADILSDLGSGLEDGSFFGVRIAALEALPARWAVGAEGDALMLFVGDRKSTRLNSSHVAISYAVFCLKKKKKKGDLYAAQ